MAACFGIDDAIRMQSGGVESRGEQVLVLKHPKDRAGAAGEYAGGKQGWGGGEFEVDAGSRDFVQSGRGKPPAWKHIIDSGNAEGQGFVGMMDMPLDRSDSGSECLERLRHHVPNLFSTQAPVNQNAKTFLNSSNINILRIHSNVSCKTMTRLVLCDSSATAKTSYDIRGFRAAWRSANAALARTLEAA